jgi:hypothetical protein
MTHHHFIRRRKHIQFPKRSVRFGTTTTKQRRKSVKERHCTYKCNSEARSHNHSCRGKARSMTYSTCVPVGLAIQHKKRMRVIILSSVACLTVPYFSTLFHKLRDFRKKVLNIKCEFWFSLKPLSEKILILRRIQRNSVIRVHRSSCKVAVILVRF